MKKYTVKIHVVDYRTAEIEVEANSAFEALEQGQEMIYSGEANYDLVHYKTWKKPSVSLIKK